jgi:hypothetical protein
MLLVNLNEAGLEAPRLDVPSAAEVVQVDGRHLPHEWLHSSEGFLKADGNEHFDDHLFPGCQPIEWDIAGSMVELELDEPAMKCDHLAFWTCAYSSFRLGWAVMAGDEFKSLQNRYRRWVSTPVMDRLRSIT